jgi:hypothetical protein
MAVGKSKAKLIQILYDQITSLIFQIKLMGSASLANGRNRKWMLGAFKGGDNKYWDGNLTDLTSMKKAFDRTELAVDMANVMNHGDPGTTADKMAIRFQSDYLSAMDRAFRTRHMGHVRSEVVSAYRRFNNTPVVLSRTVLEYTQNMISRGQ